MGEPQTPHFYDFGIFGRVLEHFISMIYDFDHELWSTNFPEHLKATTVTKSPCTWVFSVFVVHLFASVVILGLIIGFNWLINTFFQGPGVFSHFWVPHWSCLRTNHGKVSKSMKMGYQKVAQPFFSRSQGVKQLLGAPLALSRCFGVKPLLGALLASESWKSIKIMKMGHPKVA